MAVSILVCQVCQAAAHVASLIISSDIYIAQMEPHNLYHLSRSTSLDPRGEQAIQPLGKCGMGIHLVA